MEVCSLPLSYRFFYSGRKIASQQFLLFLLSCSPILSQDVQYPLPEQIGKQNHIHELRNVHRQNCTVFSEESSVMGCLLNHHIIMSHKDCAERQVYKLLCDLLVKQSYLKRRIWRVWSFQIISVQHKIHYILPLTEER